MEEENKDELKDTQQMYDKFMSLNKEEQKKFFDDVKSMVKLKYKGKLISDVDVIFGNLSRYKKVYLNIDKWGKKYVKLVGKSVFKDFKAGMKRIDASIGAYVELPEKLLDELET